MISRIRDATEGITPWETWAVAIRRMVDPTRSLRRRQWSAGCRAFFLPSPSSPLAVYVDLLRCGKHQGRGGGSSAFARPGGTGRSAAVNFKFARRLSVSSPTCPRGFLLPSHTDTKSRLDSTRPTSTPHIALAPPLGTHLARPPPLLESLASPLAPRPNRRQLVRSQRDGLRWLQINSLPWLQERSLASRRVSWPPDLRRGAPPLTLMILVQGRIMRFLPMHPSWRRGFSSP